MTRRTISPATSASTTTSAAPRRRRLRGRSSAPPSRAHGGENQVGRPLPRAARVLRRGPRARAPAHRRGARRARAALSTSSPSAGPRGLSERLAARRRRARHEAEPARASRRGRARRHGRCSTPTRRPSGCSRTTSSSCAPRRARPTPGTRGHAVELRPRAARRRRAVASPLAVRDARADARFGAATRSSARGHAARSPFRSSAHGGGLRGVLARLGRAARVWRPDETQALVALAATRLGRALERGALPRRGRGEGAQRGDPRQHRRRDRRGRPRGTIVLWNSTAEQITGVPAAEALGRRVADVAPARARGRRGGGRPASGRWRSRAAARRSGSR